MTEETMTLKAYNWMPDKDADTCVVVIAESNKEARQLGASYWGTEYGHDDHDWFILQRCKLCIEGDITGLPKGVVEAAEGLKRGFHSYIEAECDVCGTYGSLYIVNEKNQVICNDCDEKAEEKKQ